MTMILSLGLKLLWYAAVAWAVWGTLREWRKRWLRPPRNPFRVVLPPVINLLTTVALFVVIMFPLRCDQQIDDEASSVVLRAGFGTIERGDVIFVEVDGFGEVSRRLLARPGERVEIVGGQPVVDGVTLSVLDASSELDCPVLVVDDESLATMSPRASLESCSDLVLVPVSALVSHVALVYWPPPRWGDAIPKTSAP